MEANLVRKLTLAGLNYVGFVFLDTTPIILVEPAVILARDIRALKRNEAIISFDHSSFEF